MFGVITITNLAVIICRNHPNTKVEGTPMFLKVSEVIPEVKAKMDELIQRSLEQLRFVEDKILLDQAVKFIEIL